MNTSIFQDMNIVSSIDLIHLLFNREQEKRKVRAVAFYSLWFHSKKNICTIEQ
jgi:hypothetical protein